MSKSNKMTVGLLKLAFGQFEAPVGEPVFGDTPKPHILPGAKPENRRRDKPDPIPARALPPSMDTQTAPPTEPKAPMDTFSGPSTQEVQRPLPFLGELGRYFRSIFTKEQK